MCMPRILTALRCYISIVGVAASELLEADDEQDTVECMVLQISCRDLPLVKDLYSSTVGKLTFHTNTVRTRGSDHSARVIYSHVLRKPTDGPYLHCEPAQRG